MISAQNGQLSQVANYQKKVNDQKINAFSINADVNYKVVVRN